MSIILDHQLRAQIAHDASAFLKMLVRDGLRIKRSQVRVLPGSRRRNR